MSKKIELDAPCVGNLEKKYLSQAIDSGFVSSVGPFIPEFERKVAGFLGIPGAVAVQNGTAAIQMALYESGIGPGDEVIVPALTFTATVNPVLYAGAVPVIVDVDPRTWNIDPRSIEDAITSRTKAIMVVHLYGNPCHMKVIMTIAEKYRLKIIEDATESLGATYAEKHTGTFGHFGCFSFNGNKLITTGGGGMIVSSDLSRLEHIRYLINQAKDSGNPGFHSEMGFNFRMTNIEAAIGLAQLEQIKGFLAKKKQFQAIYQDILGDLPSVRFQQSESEATASAWFTCISIEGIDIPGLIRRLEKKDIPLRRVFVPINEMPYLKKFSAKAHQAKAIYDSGVCLPCSSLNRQQDIHQAAIMIKEEIHG